MLTHSTKISILYDEKKAELEEAITQEEREEFKRLLLLAAEASIAQEDG